MVIDKLILRKLKSDLELSYIESGYLNDHGVRLAIYLALYRISQLIRKT